MVGCNSLLRVSHGGSSGSGRLTLAWWPRRDQQIYMLMWGRQSHPPQRTLGQLPSSTVRKVKGERFYSGEELPKILICDMGSWVGWGWRLGLQQPVSVQAA